MNDIFEPKKESEWNEASLKSKRLNSIQELLNFYKVNPVGFTDGKYNYYWLAKNLEALYGEGQSRYTKKEKADCESLRKLINKMMKLMPPHIIFKSETISGNKTISSFNQKNFDALMDVLYEYEMKIKDLNDDHGLTFKDKEGVGMFG